MPDMRITVWVVQAEHPYVPGNPIKAFFCETSANVYAANLLNQMLKDYDLPQDAATLRWEERLKSFNKYLAGLEGADCKAVIKITQLDVED